MRVRTLLVGAQSIMRCGLRLLLERSGEVKVIAEADNGQAAVDIAVRTTPDLVILDDLLPSMHNVDVTRRLSKSLPHVGVIALSRSCDRRTMTLMLQAGARGYLLRTCELAELLEAIQAVARTGYYLCSPALDRLVAEYLLLLDDHRRGHHSSSQREHKMIQLHCKGKSVLQAVSEPINAETMENNRKNIMRKLGVDSVADLMKYAVRKRLTSSIGSLQLAVRGRQEPK